MDFRFTWISKQSSQGLKCILGKSGIIKFYPILDLTNDNIDDFFVDNNMPKHPLEAQEYSSIGCAQCTIKGQGRAERWNSSGKTECGIHL